MKSIKFILPIAIVIFSYQKMPAQCETWLESSDNQLEDSYVIYRDFVKSQQIEKAFSYWKTVYEVAPAADGKRSTVYSDGIKIYSEKFKTERSRKNKKEFAKIIQRLQEEQKVCYPNSATPILPKEILKFIKKQ